MDMHERIMDTLELLKDKEFNTFIWYLEKPNNVEGLQPLKPSALEGASRMRVVDQIMQTYPGRETQIMVAVLPKVGRKDLVKTFGKSGKGTDGDITENALLAHQISDLKAEFQRLNTASNQQTAQEMRDWMAELERKTASSSSHQQTAQEVRDLKAELERLTTALANQQTVAAASSPVAAASSPVAAVSSPVGAANREDLLQYVCELTLDPKTAHSRLSLSENNRKMEVVEEDQEYPPHKDRFMTYAQVMCKEPLTGRCYSEIECSAYVHVAVALRGIKKKGEDSRFGYNKLSWCLLYHHGVRDYKVIHKKKSTFLSISPSSSSSTSIKVAVYVDMAAGTVSFYDVSYFGILTHLHTFQSTFTEPLYVGFRGCRYRADRHISASV